MKPALLLLAFGIVLVPITACQHRVVAKAAPVNMAPAHTILTMGGMASAPARTASPIFIGATLPVPPMQSSWWKPPETDLPTNYVSAASRLFAQGMADPRGCEYRVIEVGTGNVWQGDGGVVETHGWVLPGEGTQKFAVAWNGLVYPVVSLGTNADLEADMTTMETNGPGFARWNLAIPEGTFVLQNSALSIKGCFLLRLGRANLATRLWLALQRNGRNSEVEMRRMMLKQNPSLTNLPPLSTNEVKITGGDPYHDWAMDWAWAIFDRMICAHERGDEQLALLTARQLAAAQPLIEAECAKRGFKRQPYWDSNHRGQEQPYLTFLGQLPDVLVDLERRDQEGPRVSILTAGITNVTGQTERITRLIHDLDLVGARQMGQPGGVFIEGESIVSALIGEGDAAVEPLLDCLEHDTRLTRSVTFGRDFHTGRTVISVHNVADQALKTILMASFSSVPEMRAYWDKYKGMKIQDRWYEILKDDSARARWGEAAGRMLEPVNTMHYGGGGSREATPEKVIPVRGEILRSKTNPTVTELLALRALEFPTNNPGAYDLGASCAFADCLGQWDSTNALPVLKTLSKRASTTMKYTGQQFGSQLARLGIDRAMGGDPQAFEDFADWVITTGPEQFEYHINEPLEPFEKFPTNANLESAAEKMFGTTNSSWGRLPWAGNHFGESEVNDQLVAVPAYRELLARELQKTNVYCNISMGRPDYITYSISNYSSGSFTYAFPKAAQPTNGASADLRWCDWIAVKLAEQKQITFFNPFAPVAEREKIIAEAKRKLLGK